VKRSSGLLLHPTSLPTSYPIGDIGPAARDFVDQLSRSGQRWWQMLPIGPTGMGNSPYNALSAFAGNPLLISPDDLVADGYITQKHRRQRAIPSRGPVDFALAGWQKMEYLRAAYAHFSSTPSFESFCAHEKEWLDPYAVFTVLKYRNDERSWVEWKNESLRGTTVKDEARFYKFIQYIFWQQWTRLREHCKSRGIGLIGDIPIYVAHDSADVWAHRELFHLRRDGQPSYVAGTPPDYFSKSGQWWGNPLYRWDIHKKTGYAWWKARLAHALHFFDMVRLDHFIGFRRYWKIDVTQNNAAGGCWETGPGEHFFRSVIKKGDWSRFIAEDLGATGPDVEALRDRFHFPGMKVLHFLFGKKRLSSFPANCVVYSGTHDNDTTQGWFEKLASKEQKSVLSAIKGKRKTIHWDLIRAGLKSKAVLSVFPVQDVLGLGSEARMNTPGIQSDNWGWRLSTKQFSKSLQVKLGVLTRKYGRA
jgi:4-alpha-glucanotransferase